MIAVPDTRAQVLVTGPGLLKGLKISVKKLSRCTEVKAVDNSHVECLGKCTLKIEAFGRSAEEVYFFWSAPKMFLSLTACWQLRLVYGQFPLPELEVAAELKNNGEED